MYPFEGAGVGVGGLGGCESAAVDQKVKQCDKHTEYHAMGCSFYELL